MTGIEQMVFRQASGSAARGQDPPLPPPGSVVGLRSQAGGQDGGHQVCREADRRWATRVEWVDGRRLCVIAPPRDHDFPPGARVVIEWTTPLGIMVGIGDVHGLGRDVVDNLVVDMDRVERRQRRRAYRLDITVPATLRTDDDVVAATTLDLSEGGLRCLVEMPRPPAPGEVMDLRLELRDVGVFAARVSVSWTKQRTRGRSEVGLTYVALDSGAADDLRRFVFDQQLRRRAGLG